MMETITDAFGRTITIETVDEATTYTLTDGADLHVVIGFPASHPRDAALETLAAMAPSDLPPVVSDEVPETVSAMRFRLALKGAGLYDAVKAAMEAENGAAEIMWEYAVEFHRFNAELERMAAKMGVSDQQLDDIFRAAAALPL